MAFFDAAMLLLYRLSVWSMRKGWGQTTNDCVVIAIVFYDSYCGNDEACPVSGHL